MSTISNLIRKKTAFKNKKPTALCFFYDGRFDSQLADTGLNLVGSIEFSVHHWDINIKSDNVTIIPPQEIIQHTYDFVIFNDLIKQHEHIKNMSQSLHIPSIVLGHEPYTETTYHLKKRLQESRLQYISTEYGVENNIPYGVEELPNITKDIDFLVEGNFEAKDHQLLKMFKQKIPNLTLLGNNPGLDFSITPTSYTDYRQYFARCKTFINLPTQNNISHQLLWAMANGAFVVSLHSPPIAKVINSNNGVLCNGAQHLIDTAVNHTYDQKKATKAKEIVKQFPIDIFQQKWNNIIEQYCNKVFTL